MNRFFKNNIKYDLLNKFTYKNIKKLPELEKIVLNFTFKRCNFQEILTSLVALEIVTLQKSTLTKSNVSNVTFKIRKGTPVGCKVTLRKNNVERFLANLTNDCFTSMQKNKPSEKSKNYNSITLKNVLLFRDLEKNYLFFKNLPNLNVCIIASKSTTFNELVFLLKEYKLIRNF